MITIEEIFSARYLSEFVRAAPLSSYVDISLKPDFPIKMEYSTGDQLVDSGKPSDEDLRQMFAYNIQFGASRSILVYPDCGASRHEPQKFKSSAACPEYEHSCQTCS